MRETDRCETDKQVRERQVREGQVRAQKGEVTDTHKNTARERQSDRKKENK